MCHTGGNRIYIFDVPKFAKILPQFIDLDISI